MEPWTFIESRTEPAGFVTVRADRYQLTNGTQCDWDIIVAEDSVAVLALTDDHQIVLARQFRPGPQLVLDELPGGGVEEGEPPSTAAARELVEETGYAGNIEIIGTTWVAGNITRKRWVAVATNCRPVADQQLDAAEQIDVVLRDLAEFRQQLRDGALTDPAVGYRGLDHLGLL
jgi:ADP-ribose pyrophosphatase